MISSVIRRTSILNWKKVAYLGGLFILFSGNAVTAQNANVILNNDFLSKRGKLIFTDENLHSSVKPYQKRDFRKINGIDSLENGLKYQGNYIGLQAVRNYSLIQLASEVHNLKIDPILGFSVGYDTPSSEVISEALEGGRIVYEFKDKLAFNFNGFYSKSNLLPYQDSLIDKENVISGMGYARRDGKAYSHHNFSTYLSYSPSKFFNFQLGNDRNFIGDGYRSLLLSDNSRNYPFLKITTDVWKIKYVSLFSILSDIRNSSGKPSDFTNKFSTTHYLSYNITSRISVGIFESVVFEKRDSTRRYDFDINYLNPVIFFRPVEYSMGSADNSLMGINIKLRPFKKFVVYGQAVIDEFLLSAIKEDLKKLLKPSYTSATLGWWANKYGFQTGFRWYDVLKVKNLSIQYELNYVRPFTYSHGSVYQNYGHYNQPLAHPLGANFIELVGLTRYNIKNWQIEIQGNVASYGGDKDSINFGGDIYQSYVNRKDDYGHSTAQGLKNNLFFGRLKVGYLINSESNLLIEGGVCLRSVSNALGKQKADYYFIGIRTALWNSYYDR